MPNEYPTYRLIRRERAAAPAGLSDEQRAVVDHGRGRLAVVAGPGTGKTATIVEAVADRVLERGLDPSSILVLTFSRRAAHELSQRVAARLAVTSSEPVVRTIHSYAYALLRSTAAAAGRPPPRLLDAGQADEMVRELLAGHDADGGSYWPTDLRAALRVPAFAAELREVALRLAELRVSSHAVAELARQQNRPEWAALARFMDEYRNVASLSTGTGRRGAALDQAELTTSALALLDDPATLAREQQHISCLIVDEYQDVDPAQHALIDLLAAGAEEFIAVGDPDQAIYAFRGALPGALEQLHVDDRHTLSVTHRLPRTVLAATERVAQLLPRSTRRVPMRPVVEAEQGEVQVRVLDSDADEAAWVADEFRRAHLDHDVPWSEMAVLLRSPAESAGVFMRAFDAVGIPVDAGGARPAADHPLAAALVTVVQLGAEVAPPDASVVTDLLASPLGGMGPLMLRRARRALRSNGAAGTGPGIASSHEVLRDIVTGQREVPPTLPDDLSLPLQRMADLVKAARSASDETAEQVLWRVWDRSRCAETLVAASEHGGRDAVRADEALDAVIALFDRAAGITDDVRAPNVAEFVASLRGDIAPAVEAGPRGDAVALCSAHAAKGLEWTLVAVSHVQEESWPDLRPRSSVLAVDRLIDAAAGMSVPRPMAGRLAEERRLFYVALTRASAQLLVSAVTDTESAPSQFLTDLVGDDHVAVGWPRNQRGQRRRGMTLPDLVASMRRVLVDSEPDTPRHRRAAIGLAQLANSGVGAADPRSWYGLAPPSTDAPLVSLNGRVRLSPSRIQSAGECPLRTTLEQHGGGSSPGQTQLLGIAVHALAEGVAAGATTADLDAATEEFLAAQDGLAGWQITQLRRRITAMRTALEIWLADHTSDRTFVGSEVAVDLPLPPAGSRRVHMVGRIDWLATDADGRPVVTDFKAGSVMPAQQDMEQHPQLAAYQVAAALGGVASDRGGPSEHGEAAETGSAELVYLKEGKPVLRTQRGLDEDQARAWADVFSGVADEIAGASVTARQGPHCARCPVRSSCPLWPEGRQVVQS